MCSSSPCRSFVYVAADVLFSVVMDMIFMLQAGWGGSTALSAFPTLLNQFLFSFSLSFSLPLPSPLSCLLRPLLFPPLPSSRPRLSDSSLCWDRHSVCCTKCFSSLSMPLNTDATVKVHLCVGGWVHPCVHVCMRVCVCVCVCVCVRTCMCQCGKTDSITSQTIPLTCTDPKSFLFRFRV